MSASCGASSASYSTLVGLGLGLDGFAELLSLLPDEWFDLDPGAREAGWRRVWRALDREGWTIEQLAAAAMDTEER